MEKHKQECSELTQGVDYTIDSVGRFIFTREYHLKRGYCCENGCIHCPYPTPLKSKKIS